MIYTLEFQYYLNKTLKAMLHRFDITTTAFSKYGANYSHSYNVIDVNLVQITFFRCLLALNVLDEINDTVGVTIFVVVP